MSIIELLVVIAIIGIIAATTTSRLGPRYGSCDSTAAEFAANLRLARSKAVSTGFHWQVRVTSVSTYTVNKMNPGTPWTVDGGYATRTVTLPRNVQFTLTGGRYEFNTRGNIVLNAGIPPEALIASKTLRDSSMNRDVVVSIWNSGQVY